MNIPIQNIYYLLIYAWDKAELRNLINFKKEENTTLIDLFVILLLNEVDREVKRGLVRNYLTTEEERTFVKGKLNINESIKKRTFSKMSAICATDDLSYNITINQILYNTLNKLIKVNELKKSMKYKIKNTLKHFPDVSTITINERLFNAIVWNRQNNRYKFAIHLCHLIDQNILPSQNEGTLKFKDFLGNERQMAKIFESFIKNFYKKEQKRYTKVGSRKIKWQLQGDDKSMEYLPEMLTDITLENKEERIIIDAKYYKNTLAERYDAKQIHSTNLYQIFSYLLNQRDDDVKHTNDTKGILIYPVVKDELDLSYIFQNHSIEIKTLNLNQNWQDIERRLFDIIGVN
ncbi:hypothetical protein OBK20_10600 [Empedobacter falsenii]